jgi:hypothetical protein
MEPITLLGLIAACMKLSGQVYDIINKLSTTDETVRGLGNETRSLSEVLGSMETSLKDPLIRQATMDTKSGGHWENVSQSLGDCKQTLRRLKRIAKEVKIPQGGVFRRGLSQVKLALSSGEILMYRQQISACTQTMNLSLNWITVYPTSVGSVH